MSKADIFQVKQKCHENTIPSKIHQLYEKIEHIGNSIDLKKNTLQLLEVEKDRSHHKKDTFTQLRNIENKSQMNRAQVELTIQRRPKRYASKNHRYQDSVIDSYANIFRRMSQYKPFSDKIQTDNNSEEQNDQQKQPPPQGIKHYRQLKNHPKILEFTMEKIKSSQAQLLSKSKEKQLKEQIRRISKPSYLLFDNQLQQMLQTSRKQRAKDPLKSPIIENHLSRLYNKSSKGQIILNAKESPRCSKIMQEQEAIVSIVQQRITNKNNIKKLKERMNEIVNELNRHDQRCKQKLPRIHKSRHQTDDQN